MPYTFGDNEEASRRLRRLAEVYELETRALLHELREARNGSAVPLAIDLGCGPGWTTQLIAEMLKPARTVGLDESEKYIAQARANHPRLTFLQHNVLAKPFPVSHPDLLFCRFLLTHLTDPTAALHTWAGLANTGAMLAIHETESLTSEHPALSRYYEMVGQMQRHYGQELHVGARLDAAFQGTEWRVIHSESRVIEKPAQAMAQLHLSNLRTWSRNDYAKSSFDKSEIAQLDRELETIASAAQDAGAVRNTARQILAVRI